MVSPQTLRKLVIATAHRLNTTELGVFISFARSEGWREDAEFLGEKNYALYEEDMYDDEEELENYCIAILCTKNVERRVA